MLEGEAKDSSVSESIESRTTYDLLFETSQAQAESAQQTPLQTSNLRGTAEHLIQLAHIY